MTRLAVRAADGVVLIDKMPSDLHVLLQCGAFWVCNANKDALRGPYRTRRGALSAIRQLPAAWLEMRKGRVAS